ncbi:TPA: hypothetical protein ACPY6A_001735 [Yersinia enterocolitica]
MNNFILNIFGLQTVKKERELAERLNKAGVTDVEVVGRGGVVTSTQDLVASDSFKLMKVEAKKRVVKDSDKVNTDKQ